MKIAVYCASSLGSNEAYASAARRLGDWIGRQGHTLVYGGGDAGLMGITARAVREQGGEVIGVVPGNVPFICSRPQPWCTQVITMENMSTRKRKMLDLADAFIALPGGLGTTDEITEAITMTRVGEFDKPSVLFNEAGFYDPLKALVKNMEEAGFVAPGSMTRVLFSADTQEIEAFLNTACKAKED